MVRRQVRQRVGEDHRQGPDRRALRQPRRAWASRRRRPARTTAASTTCTTRPPGRASTCRRAGPATCPTATRSHRARPSSTSGRSTANDPDWPKVQTYLNGGAAPTFTYHRFWAQSDIAMALRRLRPPLPERLMTTVPRPGIPQPGSGTVRPPRVCWCFARCRKIRASGRKLSCPSRPTAQLTESCADLVGWGCVARAWQGEAGHGRARCAREQRSRRRRTRAHLLSEHSDKPRGTDSLPPTARGGGVTYGSGEAASPVAASLPVCWFPAGAGLRTAPAGTFRYAARWSAATSWLAPWTMAPAANV